jgi:aminoglycoside N3'-acetyltransferase
MLSRNEMYGEIIDLFESEAWVFEDANITKAEEFIYPRRPYTYDELKVVYQYIFNPLFKALKLYKEAVEFKVGGEETVLNHIRTVWKGRPFAKKGSRL